MRGYVPPAGAIRAIALALALAVATIAAAPVPMTEFRVNSFADAQDAVPGDGICNTTRDVEPPVCTLRAAVIEIAALGRGGGPYVIRLEAGTYPLSVAFVNQTGEDYAQVGTSTVTLRAAGNNDLDLGADVHIIGAGRDTTVIDGGAQFRVFDVISNHATFEDLTIRNGFVVSSVRGGGGVRVGGSASASLIRVRVQGNEVNSGSVSGIAGVGGGIEARGITTIQESIVRNNRAQALGGGIYTSSDLNVIDSLIIGNRVSDVFHYVINGGLRRGSGGGIAARSARVCNDVRITGSTIMDNVSNDSGGGLAIAGDLRLTNSTVSGNVAVEGGGIFYAGRRCESAGNLRESVFRGSFSTIALNDATRGRPGAGGGLHLDGNANAQVEGVLLARNHDSTGAVVNCGGTVRALVSSGHNADDGFTCGFRTPTDSIGVYIDFAPLAYNGGPTPTHALAPSPIFANPAIDGGGRTDPGVDQRGVTRPQLAAWDIGAFEFEGVFPDPIIGIPIEVPGNITYLDAFVIPIQLGGPGIAGSEINDVLPGNLGGTFSVEIAQDRRSAIVRGAQIGLDLSKPTDNPDGARPVMFTVFVTRPLQGDVELRVNGGEIAGKVRYEGTSLWVIKPVK